MKRGIAYLRVSTELQDIERQKKLIDDYSKKNGIEVVKWIQEKESGYKSNRIGLLELMQCNNNMADIVIVADMSRFSRQDDLIQVVFNIATVLQNGLDLVFINKPVPNSKSRHGKNFLVKHFFQSRQSRYFCLI